LNYISPVRQRNTYMAVTSRWVEKATQALITAQKTYSIEETKNTLTETERQQLLHELTNSHYTLSGVKENLIKCRTYWSFAINGICIDVLCNRIGKILRAQVHRSLYRASATSACFGGFSGGTIRVVLVPTNNRRYKPEPHAPVEPEHVNGGYTYVSGNTVYIYRLEEWPKVMLHELIHHVHSIQKIRWTPKITKELYGMFGIDTAGCPERCSTLLEPTEAVVEAWAIFLHTAYMSYETGKDFKALMLEEISWNDQHIAWVMQKKQNTQGIWRESSHIFSYIVLRGILLHNLETFLNMTIPYRANALHKLWIQGWTSIDGLIKKKRVVKNGTLRMSRHGDF